MIETNTQTNEKKAYCDRCSKQLTDTVVVMAAGDILCEDCFSKEYRITTVDELLKESWWLRHFTKNPGMFLNTEDSQITYIFLIWFYLGFSL